MSPREICAGFDRIAHNGNDQVVYRSDFYQLVRIPEQVMACDRYYGSCIWMGVRSILTLIEL
jgi:hypothetical protein